MKILKNHLEGMFGRGGVKHRKQPTTALVAILLDGTETPITRTTNSGRTIYECSGVSSSRLGDVAAALNAKIERR